MADKDKIMKKVRVSFTETYQYDLDIEVHEGETVWDAIHETDTLINRDKDWLEEHRDIIKLECEYDYEGEDEED
jgi:hypothetical protein